MQTLDEVDGLPNCLEFSQPLECLYHAMQIQEKVFYCFYKLTFLRKNAKLSAVALIKREILTSREVLHALSVLVLQKKVLSKILIFLSLS